MVQTTTFTRFTLIARLTLIGAFLVSLLWSTHAAFASGTELVGRVSAMPSGSLIGAWTIGGINFVSTGSTEFRQDKGALAVGICAEVEYVGSAQPYTATKIASKNADDCSANTGTPSTGTPGATTTPGTGTPSTGTPSTGTPSTGTPSTSTPSVTPVPGTEQEAYGRVESMPATGFVGTWVVSGVSYAAPAGAEFKQRNGPLVVGACVKIHYAVNTSPLLVRELETESLSRCGSATSTPSATTTGTPDATTTGTPSATTTGTPSATTGTPGAEGELYGVLQSFPVGLVGNWNIGGMTFVASASTEFKQERGQFAVGVTVKVHFTIDSNGSNQAREIETKVANEWGSDDNGNGSVDGAEGHAFATINRFPAGLTGEWNIGGIVYLTTANTVFAQNDGAFAAGATVKVEYFIDGNGKRIARKIETTSNTGGSTSPSHFKLFGFVRGMPANGLVGQWIVDNIAFVSDGNSQFKPNNGLLGMGAYVAVEYSIQDGRNLVHEIETHVPPGAGANFVLGRIDNRGGSLQTAGLQATVWTIGGVNYTVTPATAFNDVQGGLEVGKTALVNSYVASDGSQVATQIRGVTISHWVYLPVARK